LIIGHVGVASCARAIRRDAPIVLLLVATFAPDLLDAGYSVAGICSPFGLYSHSLPVIAILAAVGALVALAVTKDVATALVVAGVVVMHLVLDLVTGEKMLWPQGPIVGLHLYKWPVVEFAVEVPLIVLGWVLLRRSSSGPRWASSRAALIVLLIVQGAMNVSMLLEHGRPATGCEVRALRHG
jgi:membrane-bound metal-dependent hydrolase YbcI (DUF457 family)